MHVTQQSVASIELSIAKQFQQTHEKGQDRRPACLNYQRLALFIALEAT
jgi:hypothetical protein